MKQKLMITSATIFLSALAAMADDAADCSAHMQATNYSIAHVSCAAAAEQVPVFSAIIVNTQVTASAATLLAKYPNVQKKIKSSLLLKNTSGKSGKSVTQLRLVKIQSPRS